MMRKEEHEAMLEAFEACVVTLRYLLDKLPLTAENMTIREGTHHMMMGIQCSRETHGIVKRPS